MMPTDETAATLVSVVVPAYNAEKTIDETLRSIRTQTYRNLEIIIVDDGSSDNTAEIATFHSRRDPRIRLIQQLNGGVAAARNRGIAEARGDFIAPIDADDLWRPAKIERQMDLMLARGPTVGLVYTWVATVDSRGMIVSTNYRPCHEGQVLPQMCGGNVLGTGSSALMRKQAIQEAGGYDTARDIQGCEDLKLYFQIAERYQFAVVKDHLTGYRVGVAGSVSSESRRMLEAYDRVMSKFQAVYPQYKPEFHNGRNAWMRWLVVRDLKERKFRAAATLMLKLFESDCLFSLKSLAWMLFSFSTVPAKRIIKAFKGSRKNFTL